MRRLILRSTMLVGSLVLSLAGRAAAGPPTEVVAMPPDAVPQAGSEVAVFVPDGTVTHSVESVADVLRRERLRQTPRVGRALAARHLPTYAQDKPPMAIADQVSQPGLRSAPNEIPGPTFDGPDICSCEPPDPTMTVGPSHLLLAINDQIQVTDKTGGLVWSLSWEAFFASVKPSGATFTSDPKVFYDPVAQRYFVTVLYITSDESQSWFMLAVSNSDQIGDDSVWQKWAFDPTVAAPGLFADYPCFGFDGDAIYITFNMFHTSPPRVDLVVLPKAQLLVTTPSPVFTQLTDVRRSDGNRAFTIQPALMYGGGACFFVSSTGRSGSSIYFYQINDPLGVPSLTTAAQPVTAYAVPPKAAQLGGGQIETNDSRLLNAVWRNNRLWCAHTVLIAGRAGVRWYEFDTSAWPAAPTTVQLGSFLPVGTHCYYPSVTVDQDNNAAFGFTRSSINEFASAWHVSRLASDPPGSVGPMVLDHSGSASYAGSRWGDYSGTVIDPTDSKTFWTIQEYAQLSGNGWGTWVTSFMMAPDSTPPHPNPMTFDAPPHAESSTALAMTASLATDPRSPPVMYNFDFVSGGPGGGGSDWQTARDYTNAGLSPNTAYTYRVAARDSAPVPNQTDWSALASAYTLANIPGLPVVTGGPSTIRIAIDPSDNPTGTEFAIQCAATVDPAWNGQYADAAGRPSPTPVWRTAAQVGQLALPVGYVVTPYCFQVFARNGDLIQTAPSAQGCAATQAATLRGDVNCDGVVNFADINPFVLALANSVAWRGAYPDCALANADVNQDGQVNFADITPFVQCLYGHCP